MLTVKQLLSNISKGQAGIPMRFIFKGLDEIYLKLKPGIVLPKAEVDGNGTLIYLKIPSEKDMKQLYDVDFWFESKAKITYDTKFKVYTNSPHFGFSYAYLFHKEGSLLWPEKYPRQFLTTAPKTRNPFSAYGFDKHIYAALKYSFNFELAGLVSRSENASVEVTDFNTKLKLLRAKKGPSTRSKKKEYKPF